MDLDCKAAMHNIKNNIQVGNLMCNAKLKLLVV